MAQESQSDAGEKIQVTIGLDENAVAQQITVAVDAVMSAVNPSERATK